MARKTTQQTTLGQRIRAARDAKKLARRELGIQIDCDPQTIYRWEEKGVDPSLASLRKIGAALGVKLGSLLD